MESILQCLSLRHQDKPRAERRWFHWYMGKFGEAHFPHGHLRQKKCQVVREARHQGRP